MTIRYVFHVASGKNIGKLYGRLRRLRGEASLSVERIRLRAGPQPAIPSSLNSHILLTGSSEPNSGFPRNSDAQRCLPRHGRPPTSLLPKAFTPRPPARSRRPVFLRPVFLRERPHSCSRPVPPHSAITRREGELERGEPGRGKTTLGAAGPSRDVATGTTKPHRGWPRGGDRRAR